MPDTNPKRKGSADGTPNVPRPRMAWVSILVLFVGLLLLSSLLRNANTKSITLGEFIDHVNAGEVVDGTVVKIGQTSVSGTIELDGQQVDVTATLPPSFDTQPLTEQLTAAHVDYDGSQPSFFFQLLVNVLPFVLLFGVAYWFLFRRAGGAATGALNLGRNKVKIYDRKEMKTTFADVAGVDEARDELKEIVDFLSNPKKYQRLGGRIPKGVLLLGPPGCGKTLLARAVAGEANVPFFFMSGSEFVEMFVGLGAARVRELFQQAKEKAPALVFLDEIDTIGKGRSGAMGSGFGAHDEREQTLNQLLVEMDGFDASKGVIIMAATNRPDVLDPALVRPGRFDRQVVVDRPDLLGREDILRVHARGVALDPSVDLRMLAARTPGSTGADLENIVNEAALLAARGDKNSVTMHDLEEAIDRATAGLERKSRVMNQKEKVRVAAHEMGHALVAHFSDNLDPVHRVTIVPRGTAALGLTMTRPLEDRYLATEPELRDMLAFAMGGRVAEELVFGEISTGAQNDLEKATQISRAMVAEYGMSDKVGPMSLGRDDASSWWNPGAQGKVSGHTAELIDSEITRLLNEAHERAEQILSNKRALLDELSNLLLVVETIDGDDLGAYADGTKPIPDHEVVRREQNPEREAAAAAAEAARPADPRRVRGIRLPPAPPMPTVD